MEMQDCRYVCVYVSMYFDTTFSLYWRNDQPRTRTRTAYLGYAYNSSSSAGNPGLHALYAYHFTSLQ